MNLHREVGCNYSYMPLVNTLRPRQNGRNFPDNILKWIFLNENVWISLELWLEFIPRGLINNIPALVQIMAWRWPGHKPLSEQIMFSYLMHICVTWPQWAKWWYTQITIKVRAWMASFVSERDARAYRLFLTYLIFIVRMFLCKYLTCIKCHNQPYWHLRFIALYWKIAELWILK